MVQIRRYLPILVLVVIALSLLAFGALERLHPQALLTEATHFLGLASSRPFTTFVLLCAGIAASTALGFPGTVAFFAAAGFLLGVPAAMAAAAIGNTAGTSLLFLALRTAFFKPKPDPADAGTLQRIRAGFERSPLAYAVFLRAMPVLPNGAVTAALAALRCPWPIFLTASAVGCQGTAAVMAWLGAQLAHELRAGRGFDAAVLSDPRWWLPLLALATLSLLPVWLRRRQRKALNAAPAIAKTGDDAD